MSRLVPILAALVLLLALVSVAHAQSTTPTVSTVAVTSDPSIDGGYAIGEAIEATLTFSEAVTVVGMPTITLDIGSTERTAEHSGAGRVPSELRSSYTVAAGDEDTDGIAMVANSPVLNGGTIRAGAASTTLTHGAAQAGNRNVNRAAPTVTSDDVTPVTVQFSEDWYYVGEIDNPTTINIPENEVEVEVTLSEDPERTVIIPLTHTPQNGATTADYSGVPQNVTFNAGVTSQTFTFSVDDPDPEEGTGERVQLSFGTTLPPGVTAGTPADTTVIFLDYSVPLVTVQFGAASYTVAESDNTVTPNVMENEVQIEVTLHRNPKRTVTIPIVTTNQGGATSADYSGVPQHVTFNSGQTSMTFTFTATDDMLNDDEESVVLSFGSTLPYRVEPATLVTAPVRSTVTITDDDVPQVKVYFSSRSYTVPEGGTRIVKVRLFPDPERTVVIPIETANQGGATSADYSGVPHSVTFNSGEWFKTFTFRAEADNEIDEGESVRLSFGATLPPGVTERTPDPSIVNITDTNIPHITVRFAQHTYTVTEHGTQTVTVTLSGDPERTVVIPIETENQGGATSADYSGVPPSVTFDSGDTAMSFTFTAEDDDDNDDGESVLLNFGASLPSGITAGMPATSLVSIIDGDVPQVTVQFGAVSYTVAEGDTEMVTITLSADPERTVVIPIETANQDGADAADYSGVPENVTFNSGDTSQTFTFTATDDMLNDDEESVVLSFGASLPADVTAETPATSLISITDNDVPQLTVQFAAASYTVAENATQTVTVTLSGYPERMVVIPIETTNQGGADAADYSGVPQSVTFNPGDIFNLGDTEQTFTFAAEEDDENDDGESVRLSFSVNLPPGVTAGTQDETTVTITDDDDPTVTVMFGAPSYAVAEGGMQAVTITLSADPERTVVIPIETADQGGATSTDYTGVPANVTFDSGETAKTFTFAATDDTEDDDGESVRLSFGASLPADVTAGTPDASIVNITDDDDPAVTVQFGAASYTVAEGSSRTVTVELSADPERTVVIPLTATNQGGATAADYSGVPQSVTFNSGETAKTFTFTAEADDEDDDGESVRLSFGASLPADVTAGTPDASIVSITDDDVPGVTVSFGQSAYTVPEGDTVTVTIALSADPERTVTIPLTTTDQGSASSADYSVPTSVTFDAGEVSKTITFTATADTEDDDDESVRLSFGAMPDPRVNPGATDEATITITDDDDPFVEVQFAQNSYTVPEGGTQAVTITLSADPERTVEIPIMATNQGSATSADYTVPASVTFNTGQMSQTITFTATDDTEDDDGESVRLSFGPMPDARVNPGTTNAATVSITDDDDPFVEVQFSQDSYTAPEGGTVSVSVTLSADPERTVVIPLVKIDQGSEEDDYSGVPSSVTFNATETVQSFTFTATQDTEDDDGESVLIAFGFDLPDRMSVGTTSQTTVMITDNDNPEVTISFGEPTYTIPEGGSQTITVTLSADPERTVVIPLTATNQGSATSGDYSVPVSVTFNPGETSQTITFTATDDTEDDDGENVLMAFGASLPDRVTPGSTRQTTIRITDNDDPEVTVSFGEPAYTVPEGGSQTVTVTLSADPERTVVIPIETADQGGATSTDYTGVPANVTFNSGETAKTFTFTAEADDENDDGESVRLSFGSVLPDRVSEGSPNEATVNIADDDDPPVTVMFAQADYVVVEGETVLVRVALSADPERTVVIPLTATNQGGATAADYSGVPQSVTFNSGETAKTFTFTAEADDDNDDGESVLLSFGASLPADVTAGTPDSSIVSITDDDVPGVTVSFGQSAYTVAEGGTQTVTVTLSADPERTIIIPIEKTDQGGASSADYSGVPSSVTFNAGEMSKPFTISATQDTVDDDDESVKLGFGTMPDERVNAGIHAEATVAITDDDDPFMTVMFGQDSHGVGEGETVNVTIRLSADPERTVIIPIEATGQNGAGSGDYSVPASVTFNDGDTEKTIAFMATDDDDDDDDESVKLSFGSSLPDRVSEGTRTETTLNIGDDDDPTVTVTFGQTAYTVDEGATQQVTVTVSADPERTIIIPITTTLQGTASTADYEGVPPSVTFTDGTSQTFTFSATDDTEDDDEESVLLSFGSVLPDRVSEGSPNEATVNIADDDDPTVTVMFGAPSYAVAEGSSRTVTVELSADPERTVVIPLTATNQGGASSTDYSGVPGSVTFNSGDTARTFTFAATDDTEDDDEESVRLSFGSVLPDRVSEGSPNEATVNIADDDDPHVTVMFAQADYVVVEGETVLVRVALSADPERTVVIPLTATNQGGASSTDYSGVPQSVIFDSGETAKTFTFTAEADDENDDGESVKLGFGAMPDTRVSEGSPAEATVTIRQFSTEFTLDCSAAVWCADLQFSDQSQLDWGRARLEHGDNRDPASALSDDSFSFRGVEYEVRGFRLRAGTYPTLANAWSREEQNRSKFVILITPAGQSSAPSRAHYRDWVLHVDGLELPFKDVVNSQYGFFDWIDADIQQIFNDWTPTTVNKVGIQEVAAVDQPPSLAVPWLPMAVEAHGAGANELRVTWIPPLWHHRIPDPTGYIVQWKLALASWSTPEAVSQREVAGRHGRQVAIGGLAENTLYSVRVFPFNDAGDGPVSEDALGRTQRHSPDLLGMSVNGANLTLRYSRDLDVDSAPESSSFVVLADAGIREVTAVQVSGRDVTLTLARPVNVFNYVQASYEEPNDPSATALQDTDGNRVESKTRLDGVEEVVNETPGSSVQPLTASFTNLPSSHDGAAVFTFNVEFSEPVWISLGLPRDDMLEVAGGTVTSALPVERSTELWEVTVLPETRGDIIVTLPGGFCTVVYDHATSDSPVPGAPCAVGDRALSNPPTVTIPGSESDQQIVQNTPAGGVPGIDGVAEVGQILSADTTNITDADGLDNVVFTYQWLADDVEIAGATASSHTLTDDDLGKPIRVRVAFTDDAGHDESLTSVPTAAVTAAEALELQAATVDGSTLTLTYNEALDTGVTLPASVFAVEVNGTPPSITGVGVVQSSVLLSLSPAVEAGDTVTVDYTRPAGTDVIKDTLGREAESFSGEVVTTNTADEENVFRSEEPPPQKSQETAPVEPEAPEPPQNLTLEIHESGKLRATWNTPSSGPAPTGYTVQWKEAGGDWADSSEVSEAEVNMTSHVIRGLTDGVEYTVQVIATTDDAESAPSGEVTTTPRETTPPGLSSATVDGATLTLTFDEPLDTGETPDRSAFAVTVAGSGRGVATVAVSGSVVTITLVTAVVAGDTVTLAYTAPTGDSSSRLQDLVGNAAASFSGRSVPNDTQEADPMTATTHDVPSAHDGSTTFTFELRFSETPREGFSYKTLRDNAFTVTGGEVVKARRLEKGKNVRWEIHVTPDGDGPVTIVLPATTDCTAQGAVCTQDRRPLYNRLDVTVPGP